MADTTFGLHMTADLELLGGTVDSMDVTKLSREQLVEYMDAATKAQNGAINLILGELSLPTVARGALLDQAPAIDEWEKSTELNRGRREKAGGLTGVGFPLTKFSKRTGWSRDFLAKADNFQIMRTFRKIMDAHMSTNWKEALRAIFNNTAWTWTHEMFPEDGTLTVHPLLNADGYISPQFGSNVFAGSEDHYMALGTGTLDETDLENMAGKLRDHGLGVSVASGGMGGRVEVWINSAQRADVEGHTNFVAPNDPIVVAADYEYAAGIGIDNYVGYNKSARVFIREVDYIPSGYVLAIATNSQPDASQFAARVNGFAPLRRRVPTQAELRGIRRIDESRYPLQDAFWEDWFGFGVALRYSAVVGKIAASYTVPTIS